MGHVMENGPNLWSSGDHQLAAWVDGGQNVMVSHFQRSTRALLSTVDIGTFTCVNNGRVNPLGSPLISDSHENPAICVDSLGYVYITRFTQTPWNIGTPRIMRTHNPYDISSWDDVHTQIKGGYDNNPAHMTHTYSFFAPYADGGVLMTHQGRMYSGGAGAGDTQPTGIMQGVKWIYYNAPGASGFVPRTVSSPNTGILGNGVGTQENLYSACPYIDKNGLTHFFSWWRAEPGTIGGVIYQVAYLRSHDRGLHWEDIHGNAQAVPFNRATMNPTAFCGIDFKDSAGVEQNLYANSCTVDKNGFPVCVTGVEAGGLYQPGQPNPGQNAVGTHLIRWDGTKWIDDRSFRLTYTSGPQSVGVLNLRNDLWAISRLNFNVELRRVGTPNEIIRMINPVNGTPYQIQIPGDPTHFAPPRGACHDPVALMQHGLVETLSTNNDIPKVNVFGDGYRVG